MTRTRADFPAQLAFLADAPCFLAAFCESRLHGKPYTVCRNRFSLDMSERERFAVALAGAFNAAGEVAGELLFLALLIAAQIQRLDALLLIESAEPAGSSVERPGLFAGIAYVFAPALILAFFIFRKREIAHGK